MVTEQKVLDIEKHLLKAMKESDVKVLDGLLHDDLLFVIPSGEVITKQKDLETHQSGNLVLEEISSSVDSISLIGETAVVTLSSTIRGKMLQQNFEGQFRYIRVWKLFDGQLKVIAGSCIAV